MVPVRASMQPIFIGDVQGCADELGELLDRARASHPGFEAWWVGDLVNRGPYNLGVLRRVRELVDAGRGRCVLGNHEIALLMTAAGLRALRPLDSFGDVLGASDADAWLEWLRRRPLLERGQLGRQRFALLHAAAHPDWSLDELEQRVRRVEARLAAPDRREAARLLAADPAGIRIAICSDASRNAAASRATAAGPRRCPAASSQPGTSAGRRAGMTTAWCMAIGRCKACTSRRNCAGSIRAACTTAAGATACSRRGFPIRRRRLRSTLPTAASGRFRHAGRITPT